MLLTKSEFKSEFGFKSLSNVSHLLSSGTITANENGLIDTNLKKNKEWCKKRKQEINIEKKEKKEKQTTQLSLEIEMLNAKLDEKRQRTKLLDLKIRQAKKEVIETAVLNKVLIMVFDDLFKNLTEFPANYASEVIDIVRAEKEPKEKLVEFLTGHIVQNLKTGLENVRKAANKYYE